MREDLLVWIDLEMSGLDPEVERILEVAVLLTDSELEVVARGPELVVHQSEAVLGAMDEWNRSHHGASGLVDRVRTSTIDDTQAEDLVLDFVRQHAAPKTAPLAGNSVWQDRRFLGRYWPRLETYLHHRIVDVSTLKELARRWHPAVVERAPKKRDAHRALFDIEDSLAELRHYRRELFR
ncbi:MAG: oligoribonuclease [Planctomycetaceae bacterium]|nr:oligoribonuclease [Planctomycetaceae bacterium]